MLYRILTDLVIFLHLLFIIFVVAGGLLVLRRAWIALLHLPTVLWAAYIEFTGHICPLTPLENYFRRMAGGDGYCGGFIEHYLLAIIYPVGLTYEIQISLGLFVVVVNMMLYSFFLYRHFSHSK
jgi:hypothetical protein